MPDPRAPKPEFAKQTLHKFTLKAGEQRQRFHPTLVKRKPADPLGFWAGGKSRFSDPRFHLDEADRFSVTYATRTFKVCFMETLLRDKRENKAGAVIPDKEINDRSVSVIEATGDLTLIDLTGDNAIRNGVPTDVLRARNQNLARKWALAFYEHPEAIDGVYYPSRLTDENNVALFGRPTTLGKLKPVKTKPLTDHLPELVDLYEHFNLVRG